MPFRNLTGACLGLCVLSACANAQQTATAAIDGVYEGTYTCAAGPRTLKVSLTTTGAGRLAGTFTFYLPPASHDRAYSYSMQGTYDAGTGRFNLAPVKWETPAPPNYTMVGMMGGFDSGTREISGRILFGGCSGFQAKAMGPANASAAVPQVPASTPKPNTQAMRSPVPDQATHKSPQAEGSKSEPSQAAGTKGAVVAGNAAPRQEPEAQRSEGAANIGSVQPEGGCRVINQTKAEAIVGGPLVDKSAGTMCAFRSQGWGADPMANKQVSVTVYLSDAPAPEELNGIRHNANWDAERGRVVVTELPDFADGAVWWWNAKHLYGTLGAVRNGRNRADIVIAGISEEAALKAAKALAAEALGGSTRSGFKYAGKKVEATEAQSEDVDTPAPPGDTISPANYNAPGLLRAVYYGKFSQLADDEMTRDYMLSMVQAYNMHRDDQEEAGLHCPEFQEIVAVMDYGAYYSSKYNRGTFAAASANQLDKGFESILLTIQSARPHILLEGREDANKFIAAHSRSGVCVTPQVKHLYDNIGRLAEARRNMPPDVDDMARYVKQLSPMGWKKYDYDGKTPVEVSMAQRVKDGCKDAMEGAAFPKQTEAHCRCIAKAAMESGLSNADLEGLASDKHMETFYRLEKTNGSFMSRRQRCD